MTDHKPMTFNGPLEAGIRAVAVLGSAYPDSFDIQRLTAFDYLLVRTSVLDGPEDLHPSAPIQTPATEVRRKIVLDALHMMMTRDLVERDVSAHGISYRAGDAAAMFLESLTTPYICALKERAKWLTNRLSEHDEEAFDAMMRELFDLWMVEFQDVLKVSENSTT
jgi:hypothetical protein